VCVSANEIPIEFTMQPTTRNYFRRYRVDKSGPSPCPCLRANQRARQPRFAHHIRALLPAPLPEKIFGAPLARCAKQLHLLPVWPKSKSRFVTFPSIPLRPILIRDAPAAEHDPSLLPVLSPASCHPACYAPSSPFSVSAREASREFFKDPPELMIPEKRSNQRRYILFQREREGGCAPLGKR